MQLIIVESPTKAKTLQKFLGKEYDVQSSFGHVRDLPKSKLGVDVEHNFEPQYVTPPKARKVISLLKGEVKKAKGTILATDADREGESISWHLAEVLDLKNPERIVFHEITKSAVEQALSNPRAIDMRMVHAQQARRILDRLVGYELSPFLWRKVAKGLSAGRVQSVAVRLIADREKEIQAFIPQEYWAIIATLKKTNGKQQTTNNSAFEATLTEKNGNPIEKLGIKNKEEADAILADLENAEYKISSIEQKETKRNPWPPFTTSTLQQGAWQKLRFPAKFTMSVAQQLYEMGHITYHRTDSLNLAQSALQNAKEYIIKEYGKEYWPGFSRVFKTKSKLAQEAHEAIRPTSLNTEPPKLTPPQKKLYNLIWSRFLASQMAEARFHATTVDISAQEYTFRATGQTLTFDGFLKVYPTAFEETTLPILEQSEILNLQSLVPSQHFTEPPARYTDATLVKALEEHGIGRPSTYASIISTIQDRGYVQKNEDKRFEPTDLGATVNDLLVAHFPRIVDIEFTALMEEQLDAIAEGASEWVPVIRDFYGPFEENLQKKYEDVQKKDIIQETTDKICPRCSSPIVMRFGRFGKFYACSSYPKCTYTEALENKTVDLGIACPKCLAMRDPENPAGLRDQKGSIVSKRTKRGKIFYGCNQYPACDFALWDKPNGETCKACGSLMVEKGKRIICSSKDCETRKN